LIRLYIAAKVPVIPAIWRGHRRRSGRFAAMMIFDGFSLRSVAAAADAGESGIGGDSADQSRGETIDES
jgi:hypothetical protein